MKKRSKVMMITIALPVVIPVVFVIAMYVIAMRTGLPGRRGGPQDAFRHTFTSAVVAKYGSPTVVQIVTLICERDAESPYDQMDIHNNSLGARIGPNEDDIYSRILTEVKQGMINSQDPEQITWLSADKWDDGF